MFIVPGICTTGATWYRTTGVTGIFFIEKVVNVEEFLKTFFTIG
jgi:hypothetical protein